MVHSRGKKGRGLAPALDALRHHTTHHMELGARSYHYIIYAGVLNGRLPPLGPWPYGSATEPGSGAYHTAWRAVIVVRPVGIDRCQQNQELAPMKTGPMHSAWPHGPYDHMTRNRGARMSHEGG
jgi:hypothetical protein